MPGHVVLTGPMGAGKTTVGEILARRLRRPLVDSDAQVVAELGMTSGAVAATLGVDRLHCAEADAFRSALASAQPAVVAAAASVGDHPDLAALIDGTFTVLLRCGSAELAARAGTGSHRRPVEPGEIDLAGRDRRLSAVADLVVDVTETDPEQVAELVLEALAGEE